MTEVAAVGAGLLLAGVAVFQVALAAGAPWGAMTYGGRVETSEGVLPARYRIMSGVAAVILAISAWIVLARGGVISSDAANRPWVEVATWVIFGYLVLNTAANLASQNATERRVMGSVTAAAAILCLVVAVGA